MSRSTIRPSHCTNDGVCAHGLRHTLASELAGEGTPVHLIQQQLGHSNLSTTDRYIRGLAPQEVVDAMKKREWSP